MVIHFKTIVLQLDHSLWDRQREYKTITFFFGLNHPISRRRGHVNLEFK